MAGYSTEVEIISASQLGALHRRNRVFVVAHTNHLSLQQREGWKCWDEQIGKHTAIAKSFIKYPQAESKVLSMDDAVPRWLSGLSYSGWWKFNKPPLNCGVPRNTPGRREAINLIGRSIVPLQAAIPLMRVKFLTSL